MFQTKGESANTRDTNDHMDPRGFLKGKAKTGIVPQLPGMEWPPVQTIPQTFEVTLSPENQEFLALAQGLDNPDSLSDFINSLLWQERLRQGYPVLRPAQTQLNALTPQGIQRFHPREWFRKR